MLALAFYKADSVGSDGNGHMMDKAIAWWTRPNKWNPFRSGKYSHVELVFNDLPDCPGVTMCFSSSPRDGGTRFKWIDLTDGKWDVFELPNATPERVAKVMRWCKANEGLPYDWPGIFGFVCWPFVRENPKWWFCSESTVRACQEGGWFPGVKPYTISPEHESRMDPETGK